MNKRHCAAAVLVVSVMSQACGTRGAPATTPRIEATAALNMNALPSAQFPGFMASVAYVIPRSPTWGVSLVGDVEGSYLVQTTMAGARVYRRNRPLFGDKRTVTGFAQILAGHAQGGVEGIYRSEGGFAFMPSIGLDYGFGGSAFHVQIGYRNVPDGVVYDSPHSHEPSDKLSDLRVLLGMTWRFRSR